MDITGIGAVFDFGGKLIDKLFPDPTQKAAANLELLRLQQAGELDALKIQMSAIVAEAQSTDPWTSRSRPAFLWVFYLLLIALVIVVPFVGVFFPAQMAQFYVNVAAGFKALPEPLWWTFTTGYLGYTAARQYGKTKGTDK